MFWYFLRGRHHHHRHHPSDPPSQQCPHTLGLAPWGLHLFSSASLGFLAWLCLLGCSSRPGLSHLFCPPPFCASSSRCSVSGFGFRSRGGGAYSHLVAVSSPIPSLRILISVSILAVFCSVVCSVRGFCFLGFLSTSSLCFPPSPFPSGFLLFCCFVFP